MGGDANIAWIAVDWGTSNLRIWAMDGADRVVAKASSDAGMATLSQTEFEPALIDLAQPFLREGHKMPVICCGMVGSRQGWAEAPYLQVPCKAPTGTDATRIQGRDPRIDVHILPGIKQTLRPDVMRGEETQIAGFLKFNPEFDGILCMPGTHTKWVHISAEEVAAKNRVCILFDGGDAAAVEHARNQWRTLTEAGASAQYWAEDSGRWVKKAES